MTIQKKSLIAKMNTTKKSTENSAATPDSPNVSAPVLGHRRGRRFAAPSVLGRRYGRRAKK